MIPKPAFLQVNQPNNEQLNNANMKHHNLKRFAEPNNFGSRGFGQRGRHNYNRHHDRSNANSNEVTCSFKGCKFSGPPDVVKFHCDIQHLELRNKYSVDFTLSTPEDIAKWRTERRAKYPTLGNVEKKSVEKTINETGTKNVLINKNNQTTSKRQKKKSKKLPPPNAPPLNFSRLSLFQKLMLQDVRKVKTDFIECLQLIVNNNFLQDK